MIKQFAETVTSFLIHEKIIQADEMEIYRYGTEQIQINLTTFIGKGINAIVANGWSKTLFFLVGMVPIRAVAGGVHASTPQRCSALTFTVYIISLFAIHLVE